MTPRAHRAVRVLGAVGLLLAVACGDRPTGSGGLDPLARRQLRQRLVAELGDAYDRPIPAAEPARLTQGARLYSTLCAPCHGVSGKGDGKTTARMGIEVADFTNPLQMSFFSDRGRLRIIDQGIEGTAMVGWGSIVPEDDLLSIFHFVRSLAKPAEGPAP